MVVQYFASTGFMNMLRKSAKALGFSQEAWFASKEGQTDYYKTIAENIIVRREVCIVEEFCDSIFASDVFFVVILLLCNA